ncbi:hypothetical protein PG996_011132 [Apiospora saccharicola]|uniref:Uncharacterized protein n=1 Tax=Apiospora saccharicola TaxID=335842 RepID=A0ABR1UE83_9PEZI
MYSWTEDFPGLAPSTFTITITPTPSSAAPSSTTIANDANSNSTNTNIKADQASPVRAYNGRIESLGAGDVGATGIPVPLTWLQFFGLVDWFLAWLKRILLASKKTRAFASALRLWDQALIDAIAAANPDAAPLAAVARAAATLARAAVPDGDLELAKQALQLFGLNDSDTVLDPPASWLADAVGPLGPGGPRRRRQGCRGCCRRLRRRAGAPSTPSELPSSRRTSS